MCSLTLDLFGLLQLLFVSLRLLLGRLIPIGLLQLLFIIDLLDLLWCDTFVGHGKPEVGDRLDLVSGFLFKIDSVLTEGEKYVAEDRVRLSAVGWDFLCLRYDLHVPLLESLLRIRVLNFRKEILNVLKLALPSTIDCLGIEVRGSEKNVFYQLVKLAHNAL